LYLTCILGLAFYPIVLHSVWLAIGMKCRPGTRFYSFQPPTPSLATQTPHPKICISGIAMLTVLFQTTVCTYTACVVQQRSPNKWKVRSTISATAGLLVQRKKRCRPPSIPPYRWRYTIFCCNWNCNCKHFALLLNFVKLLDQELIPYRCSSCLFFILLGRCSSKILNLRRFKSHRNEIWQDCSSSKYASIDQLIGFLIRRHTFEIAPLVTAASVGCPLASRTRVTSLVCATVAEPWHIRTCSCLTDYAAPLWWRRELH